MPIDVKVSRRWWDEDEEEEEEGQSTHHSGYPQGGPSSRSRTGARAGKEIFRRFSIPAVDLEEKTALMSISEGGACGDQCLFGYAALCATLGHLYSIPSPSKTSMSLFYLDDENDWIAMSSQDEFMEAVRCSAARKAMRVRVYGKTTPRCCAIEF